MSVKKLDVLIPTYNRPYIFRYTVKRWLKSRYVSKIFVVASASDEKYFRQYKNTLMNLPSSRVIYELYPTKLTSVKARNRVLRFAHGHGSEIMLMAEDDFLPIEESLGYIIEDFTKYENVGAVGGRVINIRRRRIDPDFYLNLPIADTLTKITGYVFLDLKHGPRCTDFLTHFYAIKRDVAERIEYDLIYDTPSAFREESDVHRQIKTLGYKLLYDPRVTVYHVSIDLGGCRAGMNEKQRFYWKSSNHTVFILKHERFTAKRVWYLFSMMIILLLYRPWYIHYVAKGLRDGLKTYKMKHVNAYNDLI